MAQEGVVAEGRCRCGLAGWRLIMSILSWKNQQDDAAKGRNGAILTASSNEPYIWFLIFRPGAHVHDALRVVG